MPSIWRRVTAILVLVIGALLVTQMLLGSSILRERGRLVSSVRLGHWQAVQAESELLRFWRIADIYLLQPDQARLDDLLLRFDVLWSRIDLLLHSEEAIEVRDLPGAQAELDEISRHMQRLDRAVQASLRGNTQALTGEMWRLDEIDQPLKRYIQELVINRRQQYSIDELRQRLDQLFYLSIGISVLATMLSVGVWFLAIRSQRIEQTLETAIESISDGFILLDHNERIVLANTTYADMYNMRGKLRPGMPFVDSLRQSIKTVAGTDFMSFEGMEVEADKAVETLVDWRLAQLRSGDGVWEQRLRDGRVLMVKESALPGGGYVSLRTDITRLKHIEEQLRRQILAMDLTDDAVAIFDTAGSLTYVNHAQARQLDVDEPASLIGQSWRTLYDDAEIDRLKGDVVPALEEFGVWRGEVMLSRPDGVRVPQELGLTRLPDGGVIAVTRDITERKRAETERDLLQQQVYQSQKMEAVGRLAGGIAHDFNNILAAILGYAGMLVSDLDPDSEQYMFADSIRVSGERASELVSQILAFSRSKDAHNQTSVQPGEVASEVLHMLKATLPTTIDLHLEMSETLPTIRVAKSQLNQVMMNLCINARDALPDQRGQLMLRVNAYQGEQCRRLFCGQGDGACRPRDCDANALCARALSEADAGIRMQVSENDHHARLCAGTWQPEQTYVAIEVTDNGSGIEPGVLRHVLEPFFTTKDVNKGTGLGLSAVHGIVTAHGGLLLVDTRVGEGSRFVVLMPAEMAAQSPALTAGVDMADFTRGSGSVLVVDDDREVARLLEHLLGRLGYRVAAVNAAPAALAYLDQAAQSGQPVDLVVTDQTMPDMTGIELVALAKQRYPALKIVLCTGYSETVDEAAALAAGAALFLQKPVSPADLSRQIAALLAEPAQGEPPAPGDVAAKLRSA